MNLVVFFIIKGLEVSAPIAFAALGAVFTERAGVVNIGLEGIMTTSALFFVWGSVFGGNFVMGLIAASIAGLLMALVHAVASITFRVNQIISGIAINILAVGITRLVSYLSFGQETQSKTIPFDFPHVFGINIMVLILIPLTVISWFVLYKTVFGLRLRSVGENPEAADSLGIPVFKMKYIGVLLSGIFAALGAVALVPNPWVEGMTAGRGFIALAAMILGNWDPVKAVLASMLFGFADALRFFFGDVELIPKEFITAFPYIVALFVLSGFVGKATPPAADGIPYEGPGED